jgi:hypothetical protein
MTEFLSSPRQPWDPNQTTTEPGWRGEFLAQINPNLPGPFLEGSREAVANIEWLDADPDAAVLRYDVRTFVRQLSSSGFVNEVYARYAHHGPDPQQALPDWLQPDFLHQARLSPFTPITPDERVEINQLFGTASANWRYVDSLQGRYYSFDPVPTAVNETQHFRYYLESRHLLAALRMGRIGDILDDLQKQNLSPAFLKLFENDRLVFYFKRPIGDSDVIKDVLLANNILGRGPAQDIFSIIHDNGRLQLKSWGPNDTALGDGGYNPNTYTAARYNPRLFSEAYLRLCLYAGKNPAAPYKTSFVYFLAPNNIRPDAALLNEAAQLATYPIIAAPTRQSLRLTLGSVS